MTKPEPDAVAAALEALRAELAEVRGHLAELTAAVNALASESLTIERRRVDSLIGSLTAP